MENEILFENVSFSYDGKEVFRNLNVRIPSDRHVALVGENGAGKSTFIKLLLGLYEPKQGSILVDGRPVKDRTPKERKRLFAAAFQDFYRYPLSVKENLSMCQNGEKTTADYIAALEMVGLETLKDKLDYKIGKYGENSTDLSDGQWQKIALARVLLSDAKMFLLDEPTASCIYTQKGNKKIRKPQAANQTALIFDRRAAARLLSINSIRRLCWS